MALDGENRCFECNMLCYENELIGDLYWCKTCFGRSWAQYMKKQGIGKYTVINRCIAAMKRAWTGDWKDKHGNKKT